MKHSKSFCLVFFLAGLALFSACTSEPNETQPQMQAQAAKDKEATKDKMISASGETDFDDKKFQDQLEKAARSFCHETYLQGCSGSTCPSCARICEQKVLMWRDEHVYMLKNKEMTLTPGPEKPVLPLGAFKIYARSLCDTPSRSWAKGEKPENCDSRVFGHLEEDVLSSFIAGPKNEGDTCAQLGPGSGDTSSD